MAQQDESERASLKSEEAQGRLRCEFDQAVIDTDVAWERLTEVAHSYDIDQGVVDAATATWKSRAYQRNLLFRQLQARG